MSIRPGTHIGGIRTLDDLRDRCYVDDSTGCWHWRLAFTKENPQVWIQDRTVLGQRAALILAGKLAPNARRCWATCGNRDCVNPKHCRSGSYADWGAWVKATGNWRGNPATRAANVRNGQERSKLTAEQVAEILRSDETHTALGRRLGVHHSTISNVRRGVSWRQSPTRAASVFSWRPQ